MQSSRTLPRIDRNRFVMGDASAHLGFLNCERIADRRHIHGWTVEPHFHEGLSQLFVFDQGGIEARIDDRSLSLTDAAAVWLPALASHGFNYPPDTLGWVITVPTADVTEAVDGFPWLRDWAGSPRVLRAGAAPDRMRACLDLARQIESEHAQRDEGRQAALRSLFVLLLLNLYRGLAQTGRVAPDALRSGLVERFQELLDGHLSETRSVKDYAAMLSVTPTHLSRRVKAVSGRTAGDVIFDRIMLEAKRQLVFTDKPVAEIAYGLDFSSPSYFTRFFTRQAGETPKAFRRRKRAEA